MMEGSQDDGKGKADVGRFQVRELLEHVRSPRFYAFNASIGFTAAARRAGRKAAINTVAPRRTVTAARTLTLVASTSYNWWRSSCVIQNESTKPNAMPIAASRTPSPTTMRT